MLHLHVRVTQNIDTTCFLDSDQFANLSLKVGKLHTLTTVTQCDFIAGRLLDIGCFNRSCTEVGTKSLRLKSFEIAPNLSQFSGFNPLFTPKISITLPWMLGLSLAGCTLNVLYK